MTGSILSIVAQVIIISTSTGTVTIDAGGTFHCGDTRIEAQLDPIGGFYQPSNENKVFICEDAPLLDYTRIKYHEIGHYFHFKKVPDHMMAKWIKVSNTYRVHNAFVTKYAMSDAQEDFAETFAFVAQGKKPDPEALVLRAKIAFMKKLIRVYGN